MFIAYGIYTGTDAIYTSNDSLMRIAQQVQQCFQPLALINGVCLQCCKCIGKLPGTDGKTVAIDLQFLQVDDRHNEADL
jgi:hypothetical protein